MLRIVVGALAILLGAILVAAAAPSIDAFQFVRALDRVLVHEGGFANHKHDPGGPTLEGITQRNYNAFLKSKGLPPRELTPAMRRTDEWKAHRNELYHERYWAPVGGDGLKAGVSYSVFDYAVHSGRVRAGKVLRCAVQTAMPIDQCVSISRTWAVGDQIIDAANRMNQPNLIRAIWGERGRFHARLIAGRPEAKDFENGWRRRRETGQALALTDVGVLRGNTARMPVGYGPYKAYDPDDPDETEATP